MLTVECLSYYLICYLQPIWVWYFEISSDKRAVEKNPSIVTSGLDNSVEGLSQCLSVSLSMHF